MDDNSTARTTVKESSLVFLIYALLVIIMTWPVVTHIGSQLIGGGVDQWTHLWTFHWVKESLINGRNPFYTTDIFYPVGVSLATHNIAWLNIVMWLPIQAVVGETAAYNIVFLGILALNGFTLYLLARELTGSRYAAFIGGLIFAFWPYTLSHHDHPNMIFVSWLPLVFLYLKRALAGHERRDVWLTILFITLTGWARLHLLIIGGLLIGLYAFYLLVGNLTQRNLRRLMTIGLLSGLFILPAAAPAIISQLTDENPEDIFRDEQSKYQSDLLTFFVPSYYHPLWGKGPLTRVSHNFYPVNFTPRPPFLGYITLFLALSALLMRGRQGWFWGITAVLYILIALGPELRFNGHLYPQIPMPYRLIENVYFIRLLRQPSRFNIILGLPLAILAAQGIEYWRQKLVTQRRQQWMIGLATLVILAEYATFPYPQLKYVVPQWFYQLAEEPGDFAIINLPVQLFANDKRHMFDQTIHGKAIANGKVARVPSEALAFLESTPFLHDLRRSRVDFTEAAVSQQLRPLTDANIRYLVLHKDLLTEAELAHWQTWLALPPVHDDEFLTVYDMMPHLGQDVAFASLLTPEIGLIQAELITPQSSLPAGLIQIRALWGSPTAPPRNYDVCFNLHQVKLIVQSTCFPIAAGPTTTWAANDIVHGDYSFQVDPAVIAGDYEIALALREVGKEKAMGPSASLGSIALMPALAPIEWNDRIALTNYTIQPTATYLELTFYWQAVQKVDTSYKIFIHLRDAVSQELVTQLDTLPVGWTYLTDQWQIGEIVEDHVVLPLEDVPSGQYNIFVGFYDEASGERLPTAFPDDSVLLSSYSR